MKAVVIYYSLTGNTRKVAEAVATELGAELKRVEDEVNLQDYDLVCIGTPVYCFSSAGKVRQFLQNLPRLDNKKVAAFCTMAALGGRRTINFIRRAVEGKGAAFLGGFSCPGATSPFLFFGPKLWARSHPGEQDLDRCRHFARSLKDASGIT